MKSSAPRIDASDTRQPAQGQTASAARAESQPPSGSTLASQHGATQLRLQELVDSSPRASRFAARAAILAPPRALTAGPALALQMRKATMPAHAALNKGKLRRTPTGTVGNTGTEQERQQAIWQHLNDVYNASVVRGSGYWGKVQAQTDAYINDRPRLVEQLTRVRADYDRRYQAYYVTQTQTSDRGGVETASVLDPASSSPTDTKPYSNAVNTERGQITAASNYANRDAARIEDARNRNTPGYQVKGLPNSEVLWRQYFEASRDRFWVMKDSRAQSAMQELTNIRRENVVNDITLQTGYIALPDGVDFTTAHAWQPGNNDFLAMIGTPNCAPAAHMLADHIDEMGGKTIRQIRSTGEGDAQLTRVAIEIDFETSPAVREAEDAEAELAAALEALAMIALMAFGESE